MSRLADPGSSNYRGLLETLAHVSRVTGRKRWPTPRSLPACQSIARDRVLQRPPMSTKNQPPGRTEKNWRRAVLVLLVAGIMAAAGTAAVAASGPTCGEQIAELNERLLGSAPPANPEALRQLDRGIRESVRGDLRSSGSSSPGTTESGDAEPPYVLREGIFEPAEDIMPEWDFVNCWVGHGRDQWVSVYAGSQDPDPTQGGVVVVPTAPHRATSSRRLLLQGA
jgi:hypothetical protein